MTAKRIVAVLLIVGGVLALVYGGFSYTEEQHDVDLGPVEFSVSEQEQVDLPKWLGIGAIVVGALLLVVPMGRKSS